MIRTKTPLTKPTIPDDPLRGFIAREGVPAGVGGGEGFGGGEGRGGRGVGDGVGGVGGGEGGGGDDEVGLTTFLGGHIGYYSSAKLTAADITDCPVLLPPTVSL